MKNKNQIKGKQQRSRELVYMPPGKNTFEQLQNEITEHKKTEKALQQVRDELEMRIKERTYELESALKILEHEISSSKAAEQLLRENEKRFRAIVDSTTDLLWEEDVSSGKLEWFGDIDGLLGYASGEFPRTMKGHMDNVHPEDSKLLLKEITKSLKTGKDIHVEYRIRCKDGTYRYWDERGKAVGFENKKAVKWAGAVSDITTRKKNEEKIRHTEEELKMRAKELMESNAALKVLLKQHEQDRKDFENNMLSNIKHLIMPYMENLKKNKPPSDELVYLNIIESNLNAIVSPFSTRLSFQHLNFTTREIMIADLIKDGKQDKDITGILNISLDTVKAHRRNIRRKLGIYCKKSNLRVKLLALVK